MKKNSNQHPLAVRAARADDASPLLAIINEIIRIGGTTALETPLSQTELAESFLSGPGVLTCYVAEEMSKRDLVGFQALARNPDLPVGWADISTFARVRPKIAGVGTALFAVTCQRARECGLTAINAEIRADNQGGLAFYDKMGFRTYDTLDGIPLKDGTLIDRVLKRYDLP